VWSRRKAKARTWTRVASDNANADNAWIAWAIENRSSVHAQLPAQQVCDSSQAHGGRGRQAHASWSSSCCHPLGHERKELAPCSWVSAHPVCNDGSKCRVACLSRRSFADLVVIEPRGAGKAVRRPKSARRGDSGPGRCRGGPKRERERERERALLPSKLPGDISSHQAFMSVYHDSLIELVPAVPLAEDAHAANIVGRGQTASCKVGYRAGACGERAEQKAMEAMLTCQADKKPRREEGRGEKEESRLEDERVRTEERLYQEFRLAVDSWAATMKLQGQK